MVQGCLILVSRCSMPFSWQRRSNICVAYLAVGPSAYRGGKVNWIPLSVRTVRILYGTAAIRASRNAAAEVLAVFLTSCTNANLLVRSIANIEVELAFGGLDLGDVDVEIANRISLEPFLRGPIAFDLRQSADAVSLEAAVQG